MLNNQSKEARVVAPIRGTVAGRECLRHDRTIQTGTTMADYEGYLFRCVRSD